MTPNDPYLTTLPVSRLDGWRARGQVEETEAQIGTYASAERV